MDLMPSHASIAAALLPPTVILEGFVIQPQQCCNWCWAAVAASVSDFLSGAAAKSQCEIATACLGFPCCPPQTGDWRGNEVWGLEDALSAVQHYAAPTPVQNITFAMVKQHISADKRPICCHLNQGEGHFVVISGYIDGPTSEVIVSDPLATPVAGTQTFDDLKNKFGWDKYYWVP